MYICHLFCLTFLFCLAFLPLSFCVMDTWTMSKIILFLKNSIPLNNSKMTIGPQWQKVCLHLYLYTASKEVCSTTSESYIVSVLEILKLSASMTHAQSIALGLSSTDKCHTTQWVRGCAASHYSIFIEYSVKKAFLCSSIIHHRYCEQLLWYERERE